MLVAVTMTLDVLFDEHDEGVHAVRKSVQALVRLLLPCIHAFNKADFSLREPPHQVGEAGNLLFVLGDSLVMPLVPLVKLLDGEVMLLNGSIMPGLMFKHELHGLFDVHAQQYSVNSSKRRVVE